MRKLIVFAAVICLAAFLGSGVLPEITISQDAKPAAAGDSILTIPACAFAADVDGYDFERYYALYLNYGSGYFYAPVNLPHGSTIKKIKLICFDDNGSTDLDLYFVRLKHKEGAGVLSTTLATASSSGAIDYYRTFASPVASGYVNNQKCVYHLVVHIKDHSNLKLFKAQIVFTPPSS